MPGNSGDSMRTGIPGVGGVIGGCLARAGCDVTLIDLWPANIEYIKANGISVPPTTKGNSRTTPDSPGSAAQSWRKAKWTGSDRRGTRG